MIYDFRELKIFVRNRFGVDSDKVNSNFQPITKKLSQQELNANIEFDIDGIYFKDKKGNRHKGFLYIEKGYSRGTATANGWKTMIPKFHVVNCRTIDEQKRKINFNGHYVFSTRVVKMEDLDGVEKEPLVCENCVRLHPGVYSGMLTSNFRDEVILNGEAEGDFFDHDLPKDIPTDFWGYTDGWNNLSKNYRMMKKFTCESCGIALNQNYANGYYLETHHKDGNKKNNDDDNLICLCVLCHANVDSIHQANYAKGSAKQKLMDFIKMFEDELIKVGNKYLSKYKHSSR
ncbi:MAG: HNH endonuclease signature motif containing protein [Chitinophagales bacterium]